MATTTIAVDLAKRVFEIAIADAAIEKLSSARRVSVQDPLVEAIGGVYSAS